MQLGLSNFLVDQGLEKYTLILILSLPIIATLLTFLKYVVGLRYVKFYIPLIITITLFDLSVNNGILEPIKGIKYGLPIILIATGLIFFFQFILEKTIMHFVSKLSLIFSLSVFFLPIIYYFAKVNGSIGFLSTNTISILTLVIAINLFTVSLIKRGLVRSIKTVAENILISIGIFYLITLPLVSDLIFTYPELMIFVILINILIGKYTGLRWIELIRFSKILTETNPNFDEK